MAARIALVAVVVLGFATSALAEEGLSGGVAYVKRMLISINATVEVCDDDTAERLAKAAAPWGCATTICAKHGGDFTSFKLLWKRIDLGLPAIVAQGPWTELTAKTIARMFQYGPRVSVFVRATQYVEGELVLTAIVVEVPPCPRSNSAISSLPACE